MTGTFHGTRCINGVEKLYTYNTTIVLLLPYFILQRQHHESSTALTTHSHCPPQDTATSSSTCVQSLPHTFKCRPYRRTWSWDGRGCMFTLLPLPSGGVWEPPCCPLALAWPSSASSVILYFTALLREKQPEKDPVEQKGSEGPN